MCINPNLHRLNITDMANTDTNDSSIYIRSYTGDDSIPVFLSFAIEQYKQYKGISGSKAAEVLASSGVLKHLEEFYDVLHTQSAQWLMEEIDIIVQSKKFRQ